MFFVGLLARCAARAVLIRATTMAALALPSRDRRIRSSGRSGARVFARACDAIAERAQPTRGAVDEP